MTNKKLHFFSLWDFFVKKKKNKQIQSAINLVGKPVTAGIDGPVIGEVSSVYSDGSYEVKLSEEGQEWLSNTDLESGLKPSVKFQIKQDDYKVD
jgi:hypothetical protein